MRQCGRLRTNVVAIGVFAAMRRALETMSWPLSARIIDVCLPWVYLNRVRQCGSSNNWYSLSRRPSTMPMNIFNKQMISQSKFEIPRSPSEMRPTPTNQWWRYLCQVTVPTERYAIQTYETSRSTQTTTVVASARQIVWCLLQPSKLPTSSMTIRSW